jgi:ribosomal protein S18 acetylase RimI-like enzyme
VTAALGERLPRPTTAAPLDELLEILQSLKHELERREETVAGNWVEDSAAELRSGRKVGWYYPAAEGAGIGFYARRGSDAFGHVQVATGPSAVAQAARLATTLLDALPPDVTAIDLGFTGLTPEEERAVTSRLSERPGSASIERDRMERELGPADAEAPARLNEGLILVPVRAVTLEALAELDQKAFQGTQDELLVGPNRSDYARVMESILDGRLGRFLDEASTALLYEDPPRLIGALLSAEQSPRKAVFVEFVVDPAERRRGHGRFLFRWGLRALWALGYSSVRLWVTSTNQPARRLYETFGFRSTATATIYRWERPTAAPQPHSAR